MEETNIPDQLTYHAPSQETTKEPKDALFMAARIISAIFTPFMVPFVAFLLLFFFTYLQKIKRNSKRKKEKAKADTGRKSD